MKNFKLSVLLLVIISLTSACSPQKTIVKMDEQGNIVEVIDELLDYTNALDEVCINGVVYYSSNNLKQLSVKVTTNQLNNPVYHNC